MPTRKITPISDWTLSVVRVTKSIDRTPINPKRHREHDDERHVKERNSP